MSEPMSEPMSDGEAEAAPSWLLVLQEDSWNVGGWLLPRLMAAHPELREALEREGAVVVVFDCAGPAVLSEALAGAVGRFRALGDSRRPLYLAATGVSGIRLWEEALASPAIDGSRPHLLGVCHQTKVFTDGRTQTSVPRNELEQIAALFDAALEQDRAR